MKKILFLNILILLFNTCDEPADITCYGGAEIDDCGVCCGGDSGVECSTGPGTGAMDTCGVCFGDDTECGGCTDEDALNYDSNATFNNGSCEYNPDDYWQLDVALLTEDTWCVNNEYCDTTPDNEMSELDCECNNYNDNEQDCIENGGSFCEWNGTFEAKVGFPIYWINTSEFDIEVIIEEEDSSCKPINDIFGEQIVDNQIECILIDNQESCEEYNGEEGEYSQNPCEWYTSAWSNFGQEIQIIPANTVSFADGEFFEGFIEPTEKTYSVKIYIHGSNQLIGEQNAKIIVTQ